VYDGNFFLCYETSERLQQVDYAALDREMRNEAKE
jgi:hypothetical protein